MTREQSLDLLRADVAGMNQPALETALAAARNPHVRLRDLPGGDFCWAIMDLVPGTESKAVWSFTVPLQSLPRVTTYFRENGAFDRYLRARAKRAADYLNQIRNKLGVEMTIEEAMR